MRVDIIVASRDALALTKLPPKALSSQEEKIFGIEKKAFSSGPVLINLPLLQHPR